MRGSIGNRVRTLARGACLGGLLLVLPLLTSTYAHAQEVPSIDELAEWAGSEEDAALLREGIGRRVAMASPAEATLWIQLLAVVESVDSELAPVAVRAVGLAMDAQGRDGSVLILDALSDEPAEGEAPLLALAAHLADPEDPGHAAEIRARLVQAHPEATETPEARLLLARFYLSGTDARREEALRMLEELIVQLPTHPVAPEARRLYEANRESVNESGSGGGVR